MNFSKEMAFIRASDRTPEEKLDQMTRVCMARNPQWDYRKALMMVAVTEQDLLRQYQDGEQ